MKDAVQHGQLIRFDAFEVDLDAGELRRNGRKVRLTGQPFQVLAVLLQHPGLVVTREELQKELWPDTIVEFDHSLNTAINKIRESLGDSAEKPHFVETLPRRGYRFIAPLWAPQEKPGPDPPLEERVKATASGTAAEEPTRTESQSSGSARWMLLSAGTAVLLGALVLAIWILRSPLPPPRITDYVQLTNDGRPRTIGGTDGNKLFVNAFQPDELAQISTSDGRSSIFRMDIPNAKQCGGTVPTLRDVSPDGSQLLVLCLIELNANQVWIVGALGGPARFLVNAQDAAWSPDGRSIVYSTPEGAIYQVPTEGGESRLIASSVTTKGEYILLRDLAWSPNGRSIRFTREATIWEVSAQGVNPHRLLSQKNWPLPSCCGRWTTDGAFFVFIYGDTPFSECVSERGAHLEALDERQGRWGPPHANPIELIGGPIHWADPVPSRDGKRIYARGVTIRGELVRYDAPTKQLQPYLGGISVLDLSFSRDGKYVAYVTFPEGVLWRANRDGTDVVRLTQAPEIHPSGPSWSPDSSEVVYAAGLPSGRNGLFSVSSQGGSSTPLLRVQSQFSYSDANWSPDGKHIVFATLPIDFDAPIKIGDVKIEILDLATSSVSVLPHSEGLYSARWSPNGRYIAGITLLNQELRIYDLKNQKWISIAKSIANYPAWSNDSQFVYGASYGDKVGVYRTPVSGGPSELILDFKGIRQTGWWGQWFGLDPTGAPLLLRDAGAYDIYALTLEREHTDTKSR